jgi:integrase
VARETHGDYGDEMTAIILFAAYTGVRPGELSALQWTDLDPANRQAVISRALDGQGGEKAPKNGLARPIILPPRALEALSLVARRTDSPHVFHSPRGKRLNKGSLNYLWRPVAAAWRAQGGRDVDLYELRHACATLLERGLAPADVAVQLGHGRGQAGSDPVRTPGRRPCAGPSADGLRGRRPQADVRSRSSRR